MRCGYIGVLWMHHERDAHCFEAAARKFGSMLSGTTRHLTAFYIREIDAPFFEDFSLSQHTANTTATFRSVPGICFKLRGTIDGTQLITNRLLQTLQVLLYRRQIHSLPLI